MNNLESTKFLGSFVTKLFNNTNRAKLRWEIPFNLDPLIYTWIGNETITDNANLSIRYSSHLEIYTVNIALFRKTECKKHRQCVGVSSSILSNDRLFEMYRQYLEINEWLPK